MEITSKIRIKILVNFLEEAQYKIFLILILIQFQKILNSPLEFNKKIKISLKCKTLIQQELEKNNLFRMDSDSELFQNWFDEEDFLIKSAQSMKVSQELFNDYINEKKNRYN